MNTVFEDFQQITVMMSNLQHFVLLIIAHRNEEVTSEVPIISLLRFNVSLNHFKIYLKVKTFTCSLFFYFETI